MLGFTRSYNSLFSIRVLINWNSCDDFKKSTSFWSIRLRQNGWNELLRQPYTWMSGVRDFHRLPSKTCALIPVCPGIQPNSSFAIFSVQVG